MNEIKIRILTLVGIVLLLIGIVIGVIGYVNYNNKSCIANPVDYANNHSNEYGWDYVMPININNLDKFQK